MTSELLNINWPILFNGLDIDATWSIFHSTMLQLIDKYVPTILISPSANVDELCHLKGCEAET